jgi:2-keto-4-pentenoate hydratase
MAEAAPDTTRIAHATDMLLAVRHGGATTHGLGDAAPATETEALAIQRAVLARRGGTIGGWKCATPPGKPVSQALLDARGILPGPASWAVAPGAKIGIETEIAFRLGRSLPPRATPWTRAEVIEAVAACFPAIELVATRYADMTAVSLLEAMADNIAHAGLVLGAEVPDWRQRDLDDLTVHQAAGGVMQVARRGANPAGDPLLSLTRLANHLHAFGLQLEAGQVVTTGSWTGLLWVPGGQRIVGGFEGIGEVVVDLG